MIEIRTHGRGGQGAVVASEILADAFFREKKYVQAFPAFGVERRGAPVVSFTRVSDREIRERCEIYEPDHLIVLDPVLLDTVNITLGLKEGGWIVINTNRDLSESELLKKFRIATVDANKIALKYGLGSRSAPIVNTAIVGAFAGATKLVGLEAVLSSIEEFAPLRKENNRKAAEEAYRTVSFASQ
ncbi:MAG TPA: 2-oxoacid:acceptor oxidoreductase family protein [Candidatus Bathyarchaeia archaeon]|nr:2-oxoacid:acceptor oxidoreductase family protein [Candidatus Bathyarchaeia archaeon]